MDGGEAVEILARSPTTTGIFVGFDGTLSEVGDRPDEARPVSGASEVLSGLAQVFGVVAVVSGRSLEDLRDRFAPPGVVLCASYGRERSDRRGLRRRTEGWETVGIAAVASTEGMPGVVVQHRGAGVSLHYRRAPELVDDVTAVAADLAREFELELRTGTLAVELVVPGAGKGDALVELIDDYELGAFLLAGDDGVDLEAFHRMRALEVPSVLVGVASEETPEALHDAADLVVAGPTDLLDFLERVRDGFRRRPG